ncbi:MAG TPA: hypothetical protein VJN71_05020 [Nitrososphaerales archaeon]|nr:hypothetical protein [Nitrososphaerales archaeon]
MKIDHPRECYVVEEVGGKMIYTSWDREEAFQLADSLLISGRETRNKLVKKSILAPPEV